MQERKLPATIRIGNSEIGFEKPVFVIAEIGVNHDGSVEKAKQLIRAAKEAGANAVKFQKRDIPSLYQENVLKDLDSQEHGFQYAITVQKKVEFGEKEYRELVDFAKKENILLLVTPFDEASVTFLQKFNLPAYKVGSCDMTNFVLLEKILETKKPMILSTGMSSLEEVDATVEFLKSKKASFVLLHCESTYPANLDDLNIGLIPLYEKRYGVPIGYSGHERDIDTTGAAVALGSVVIERHITLDKNGEGPDHAASLEKEEFKAMVALVRKMERVRGAVKRLSQGEAVNRQVLGKSLVALRDIQIGEKITRDAIGAKSTPFGGISPQKLYELVGLTAKRNIATDDIFSESDLPSAHKAHGTTIPTFNSNWGFKAGFTDFEGRIKSNIKLLEFHLTERDLYAPFDPKKKFDLELYLHVPIYGKGDLIVDLCSEDDRARAESIKITKDTIALARRMSPYFKGTPKIVMHVGGMTIEPMPKEKWDAMLERAAEAIEGIDRTGVEFLPETLTSLAWHKGGQWYQNVFNKPGEVKKICKRFDLNMCFDTSHAWLSSHYFGFDFYDFVKECAPYIKHLHLVDGKAPNDEGLQINDGDIDFKRFFDILTKYGPKNISWVPEIWMGHLDGLKGFMIALDRLQALKHPFLIGK